MRSERGGKGGMVVVVRGPAHGDPFHEEMQNNILVIRFDCSKHWTCAQSCDTSVAAQYVCAENTPAAVLGAEVHLTRDNRHSIMAQRTTRILPDEEIRRETEGALEGRRAEGR